MRRTVVRLGFAAAVLFLPFAARAAKSEKTKATHFTLLFVGGAGGDETSPTLRRLKARLESLDPKTDRVVFTGYRGDASELIDELDVLALPSWSEGMPLVTLEAMARGKPVVATRVGGIPEVVVDGVTGTLVPVRDPQRLAAALRALIADPERARAFGAAGRDRVREQFSATETVSRVLAIYEELGPRA